jgi:excinuclease ABC subunit B
MAKTPEKTSRDDRGSAKDSPRKRSSPLTDYHDASEPLHPGFGEAPQAEFAGAPLKGSVSDWAAQIAREAEQEARPTSPQGRQTWGEVAPQGGAGGGEHGDHPTPLLRSDPPPRGEGKAAKKIPERSSSPTRTARGTSMGGAASAKERAAVGLNPVAG